MSVAERAVAHEFVHLHVHSEYSLSEGMVRIQSLAERVAKERQPAVALTDLSNVHGVIKFYRACLAHGVKPVIGCDIWAENPVRADRVDRLIVLCRDRDGYRNLSKFLTAAYLRGPRGGKVVVPWDELAAGGNGLLALLDDHDGALAKLAAPTEARFIPPVLEKYQEVFGDALYFQISRVGYAGEQAYIGRIAQVAAEHGLGLVATNRAEFIAEDEFHAHEIRVCINEGRELRDARRSRRFTPQQYLKSGAEMATLFADLPEAIANTAEVAKRCNLFFEFDKNYLPDYPEADGQPESHILRRDALAGLGARLSVAPAAADADAEYRARLDMELGVIDKMGFAGYFLIVADFIRWAKDNDIPVGPGRGSGAGSLVAWATGITELDPLRHGLLFERFLNAERISLPDFDIDFCVDGRDRVIDYVAERYGREQVAQIITFGTLAAKAAVRDVGRAMGLPYGLCDAIAKMIPFEIGMTLRKALKREEGLRKRYEDDAEIKQLINNAMQLEGIARNVSTHAAGVVIAPRALTEYTPLYADAQVKQAATQLDKDDLESIGLVKFDFLGLRTLTIIKRALQLINRGRDAAPLTLADIPLDDAATYKMIEAGGTAAVFQLESRGMREIIIRLKPDKFDDLVALVALYRPGPLQSGMVDDFINRKHGREAIRYPHPKLQPILEPTYGVILYQEQVMQIAQVLAGYTLGEADLLRAAMGKKKVEVMDQQRNIFIQGARANGVAGGLAETIFALMEKFAGYGFNKSHSAAYALIAYHTAWLKTHHPAAFMAATLTAEMRDTDKILALRNACAAMGLEILPPDVNKCYHGFYPLAERKILYGIGAIKGVGKNVSDDIEAARAAGGAFKDMFDFCRRFDSASTANKRVLDALVKSGAFDEFGHRAQLMSHIADALAAGEQHRAAADQHNIFGEAAAAPAPPAAHKVPPWSEQERLAAEKEALGLYLTGHPYTRYRRELSQVTRPARALDLNTPKPGMFGGLVTAVRAIQTRRGKMAFVTLDNTVETVETNLFSAQYAKYRPLLKKGNALVVYGEFEADERSGGVKMTADRVADMDGFRQACLRRIHINLTTAHVDRKFMHAVQSALTPHRGGRVEITVGCKTRQGARGRLKLGAAWRVRPAGELIDALHDLIGGEQLEFEYDTAKFRAPKIPHTEAVRAQMRRAG